MYRTKSESAVSHRRQMETGVARRQFNSEKCNKQHIGRLAKYARLCCLWAMFQASIFTACLYRVQSTRLSSPAGLAGQEPTKRRTGSGHFYRLAHSNRLKRAYSMYSVIIISLYAYWVSVSIVAALLDLNIFASYRYLDCYLLGRFSVNGRASIGTKYVCLQLTLGILITRVITTLNTLDLYVQAMDFLHRDLEDVEQSIWRRNLTCHPMHEPLGIIGGVDKMAATRIERGTGNGHEFYYKRCEPKPRFAGDNSLRSNDHALDRGTGGWPNLCQGHEREHGQEQEREQVIDYDDEDIFIKTNCPAGDLVILKLNRFPKNWHQLNIVVLLTLASWTVVMCFWLSWTLYMMTPTIVTRRGFEWSYANCVSYIRNYGAGSAARAAEFEFIYKFDQDEDTGARKPEDAGVVLPMKNFVSGYYHLLRIIADYLESVMFFFDAIAYMAGYVIIQAQIYYDVIVNAREIHKRLVRLREIRWAQQALSQCCYDDRLALIRQSLPDSRQPLHPIKPTIVLGAHTMGMKYQSSLDQLNYDTKFETLMLQALLLDHFQTLKKYNDCLSLCTMIGVTLWSGFTCTTLIWLGISGSDAIHYEFYIAELGLSILLLSYLIVLSIIGITNRKFYPIITSLMALDDTCSITKQRWSAFINYYHPRPMFSSTITSKEISLLLALKMVAWVFSALFVVLGFFHLRKERQKGHRGV